MAEASRSRSIDDLTSAMGITAPSLYAAFGDKESLYLESVERYKSGLGNSGRILAGEATARAAMAGKTISDIAIARRQRSRPQPTETIKAVAAILR